MTQHAPTATGNQPAALVRQRPRGLGRIVKTVTEWSERRRSRCDLAQLDDRLLRDVGLSPAEAMREAAVPFWKP